MTEASGKLLLTVAEAARELSIGRTLMFEHVRRGEIRSVRIGRCRRIARPDLQAFVEQLRDEAGQSSEKSESSLGWA